MALINDPVSLLLDIGGKVIDRIFPDPAQKAAAQLELFKLQQTGELAALTADVELAKGQLDINKEEAQSTSLFVSGWRPYLGWVLGTGFAMQFLVSPLGTWVAALLGHTIAFPIMDLSQMLPLLLGMLGLGGLRTYEKVKDVASK